MTVKRRGQLLWKMEDYRSFVVSQCNVSAKGSSLLTALLWQCSNDYKEPNTKQGVSYCHGRKVLMPLWMSHSSTTWSTVVQELLWVLVCYCFSTMLVLNGGGCMFVSSNEKRRASTVRWFCGIQESRVVPHLLECSFITGKSNGWLAWCFVWECQQSTKLGLLQHSSQNPWASANCTKWNPNWRPANTLGRERCFSGALN